MVLSIAHDLRGRVKSHRLGIEQSGGKGGGIAAAQIGADPHQPGKGDGVAFGKAIAAKAFDLAKTAFGKLRFIAARDHAADQFVPKCVHPAHPAECRHRPAQHIRFAGGEARRNNRQLHRLFLKQWHAQRLAQHLFQFVRRAVIGVGRGKFHRLAPLPPPQIGVNHFALDRPRADNRHLNRQIVKTARPDAGQHVHLGAAFNLENADAVAAPQHGINIGRIIGHAVQRIAGAAGGRDQIKCLGNARQHPQRQHIDLHQPQCVNIILVPFDERPVRHGGVADWHQFIQPPGGQHKAADVLRQMARGHQQLLNNAVHPGDFGIVDVEPRLGKAGLVQFARKTAPDGRCQPGGDILRQAQRLADLAHRAARAIMDGGGGNGGAVAAIAGIDILDHLLAPFMFKIDINVGRFAAFFGNETRKQQIIFAGVHRRNPQYVTDGGIGGAAPALAQNPPRLRPGDNVVDGQEIGRIFHLRDQRQFLVDQRLHRGWHPVWPARGGAAAHQFGQPPLGIIARWHRLAGIFIAQLVERKADPGEKARSLCHRIGMGGEQPGDFGGAVQMAFGIGRQPLARPRHRGVTADGGHHIVQRAGGGIGVKRVAGGDQRDARRIGDGGQRRQPPPIAPAARHDRAQPQRAGEGRRHLAQHRRIARTRHPRRIGQQDQLQWCASPTPA